jgi:hypothetical protein
LAPPLKKLCDADSSREGGGGWLVWVHGARDDDINMTPINMYKVSPLALRLSSTLSLFFALASSSFYTLLLLLLLLSSSSSSF